MFPVTSLGQVATSLASEVSRAAAAAAAAHLTNALVDGRDNTQPPVLSPREVGGFDQCVGTCAGGSWPQLSSTDGTPAHKTPVMPNVTRRRTIIVSAAVTGICLSAVICRLEHKRARIRSIFNESVSTLTSFSKTVTG
ncbi:hypothetical protein JOB18_022149 [Solea senegalensis]|uniref:Uncharacterized protein n=1 Tax=Solea senegalensis TaxID=28829 RepID=A0AAV6RHV6_SOLSE|nr:hypothetical protein JOB18_022149 [Solea senegalensis]